MISIRNLTKDYGNGPILEHVNLEIEKGESVVIIGGSGCGKSTLLRCINRLIVPEEGEIYIEGENILDKRANIDQIRRKMGMVYQHFNLFSHLSVLENIILAPMQVAGMNRTDAVAEAKQLLKQVGMAGREAAMPSSLSGGQKKRVAIARTLVMHPKVILFDEPTSALDPTMVDEVESVIRNLVETGMTSVLVTHEMRFARNVSSKVLFLAERGIYEQGTPQEVFDRPSRPLTQRFLYRSRMFEAKLEPASLDLYALASELRAFLNRYEFESRQERLIPVVCDELLYPVFHAANGAATEGSESTARHTLLVGLQGGIRRPVGRRLSGRDQPQAPEQLLQLLLQPSARKRVGSLHPDVSPASGGRQGGRGRHTSRQSSGRSSLSRMCDSASLSPSVRRSKIPRNICLRSSSTSAALAAPSSVSDSSVARLSPGSTFRAM